MDRLIKADFHLHTYHSDNRDRMTPAEYARLARALGIQALGFCDHHHNLTQAAWHTLQAEIQGLGGDDLLLTTGYEATWVDGHLCVLGKRDFDGESVAACRRQMWSPANTRILAHPDNNSCAWHLPLPVGVNAVEVINGGQDLYAYRATSPCNGLQTYRRYLLLNHPVAAAAQSDCHARAVFGRVWTGLYLPADTPLTWANVQSALVAGRSFAAMGDMPIRLWTETGTQMGDTLVDGACRELGWEAPPGSEVTVYVADRPVAYVASGDGSGRVRLQGNGPVWLLAKRGLAWAVSSPIWVRNQPVDTAHARAQMAADSALQHRADGLRHRLDWLRSLEPAWAQQALPIREVVDWLAALLPEHWAEEDYAFSTGHDPVGVAQARLAAAEAIVAPVLDEVIRAAEVQPAPEHTTPRLVVARPPSSSQPDERRGLVQFTVEVPREWTEIRLVDAAGAEVPFVAEAIPGRRDPIHSRRTPEQIDEIYTWLAHGEMHEYVLRDFRTWREGDILFIRFDLYPEAFGLRPEPDSAAAAALAEAVHAPGLAQIQVHTRMPSRFAVIAELALPEDAQRTHLRVEQGAPTASLAERLQRCFSPDTLAAGAELDVQVVQVR